MSLAAVLAADFRKPCFDHQFVEFENNCDAPARALAWHMRTGKSKAIIDKASHLHLRGKVDGILIFAPNGVHANWVEVEIPKHAWRSVRYVPLIWRSASNSKKAEKKLTLAARRQWRADRDAWYERLKKARHTDELMVLAVNSESMTRDDVRKAVAFFLRHRKKVFLVVDESDDFGTPGTKRTKMARALARRCAYRELLSGTIVTGSPLAAFSQFEILEKEALGFARYEDFKAHYAVYEEQYGVGGRMYPALIGFKNLDDLRERMAKYTSVVLREDCHDMPDLEREVRKIKATEEQLRIYRELLNSFLFTIKGQELSVGEKCARLNKLQQVFSGFVFDENKKLIRIPGKNPRLDLLAREVYLAPGKVIIWCAFQPDMDMVRKRLLIEGYEVAEYHGRVSGQAKSDSLRAFRENRDIKPLIGHTQAGGRGLDMSVASTIIYYSHTFKARFRVQSMERATQIGGRNIKVLDFVAPGPDSYIIKTTDNRINIADDIAGRGMKEFLAGIRL